MRGLLPEVDGYGWDERTDCAFLHRGPRSTWGRFYMTAQVFDRGDRFDAILYDSGGMAFARGCGVTPAEALAATGFRRSEER